MESNVALTAALSLVRRLPPLQIHHSLLGLVCLAPRLKEELCRRVFLPFKILYDNAAGKYFVACEYNQEDNFFRSPWTNEYFPGSSNVGDVSPNVRRSAYKPSDSMRELEIECNVIFDFYRKAYYRGGISSVYVWDLAQAGNFAAAFCIQRERDAETDFFTSSCWNSMHVAKISRASSNAVYITIDACVHLEVKDDNEKEGNFNFTCQLSQLAEKQIVLADHSLSSRSGIIAAIGKMIEELENNLRKNVESIYVTKLQEILNGMKPSP